MLPELHHLLAKARSQKSDIERFYERLKGRHHRDLDRLFREAHGRAFAEVDCLSCGACCRSPGPRFTQADVSRLADHLSIRPSELAERYLRVDEDRDTVLRELPWPFLGEDNRCAVYEVRPKACREYPRADQKGMQRLLGIAAKNAPLCPAAFLVTQELRRAVSPRG